jgi:hypothetical protein
VLSVVPLALLQLPNLIASGMPAATLARIAGPNGAADLVRAAGLTLPIMVCVVPVGALLARRHRAWPTLLAGVVLIGCADLLGDSARTLALIGLDRALHGLGAGLALPASLAVAWERSGRWRRLLSRCWMVIMLVSLLGAVPLLRDRLTGGHWQVAVAPLPWLTAAALAAAALYVAAAGGSGPPPRAAVTPAERSQLALLAVPAVGLAALDVGVAGQPSSPASAIAAAGIAVLVLAGLAMTTSADAVTGGQRGQRGRLCFPLAGAAAGFATAPTAGAIGSLRPLTAGPHPALRAFLLPLAAAAAGCIVAAGIAALCRRGAEPPARGPGGPETDGAGWPGTEDTNPSRPGRAARRDANTPGRPGRRDADTPGRAGLRDANTPGPARSGGALRGRAGAHAGAHAAAHRGSGGPLRLVLAGLLLAAAGLVTVRAAGPGGGPAGLAAGYGLLAGGLGLALCAAIAEATAAGAMAGLTLIVAGALTGNLVAGAIQIRMIGAGAAGAARATATGAASSAEGVLTRATSLWELLAAGVVVAAAAATLFIGRARHGREEVPGRG